MGNRLILLSTSRAQRCNMRKPMMDDTQNQGSENRIGHRTVQATGYKFYRFNRFNRSTTNATLMQPQPSPAPLSLTTQLLSLCKDVFLAATLFLLLPFPSLPPYNGQYNHLSPPQHTTITWPHPSPAPASLALDKRSKPKSPILENFHLLERTGRVLVRSYQSVSGQFTGSIPIFSRTVPNAESDAGRFTVRPANSVDFQNYTQNR
ncbi:hypothetical protein PIB30_002534 [Stylosanthes scabra]|uniref:Uncharacterized protein n=1 Tax=Stylosanthes scabra TaxID=79078 RepID=A0ABU6Y1C6_9FABA|nr:hypothetical protein [Stylosanthes scabra]